MERSRASAPVHATPRLRTKGTRRNLLTVTADTKRRLPSTSSPLRAEHGRVGRQGLWTARLSGLDGSQDVPARLSWSTDRRPAAPTAAGAAARCTGARAGTDVRPHPLAPALFSLLMKVSRGAQALNQSLDVLDRPPLLPVHRNITARGSGHAKHQHAVVFATDTGRRRFTLGGE